MAANILFSELRLFIAPASDVYEKSLFLAFLFSPARLQAFVTHLSFLAVCIYTYIHISTYISTYISSCISSCIYIYIYIYIYVYVCLYMYM